MKSMRCQMSGLLLVFLLAPGWSVVAQGFFADGEKLLQENKPAEALVYLEASLGQGQVTERLFLYLGLAYHATGQNERARSMFRRGLEFKGPLSAALHFNLGNLEMAIGQHSLAVVAYSQALDLAPRDGDVFLNRANARLVLGQYQGALEDYIQVLALQPQNPQRAEIMRLTGLLRSHLAAQEAAALRAEAEKLAQVAREEEARKEAERIAAIQEEDRRQAELARLAEEERRRREEAALIAEENRKREELLAKIRESLARAAQETQNLQAGEGEIKNIQEVLDLAP